MLDLFQLLSSFGFGKQEGKKEEKTSILAAGAEPWFFLGAIPRRAPDSTGQ